MQDVNVRRAWSFAGGELASGETHRSCSEYYPTNRLDLKVLLNMVPGGPWLRSGLLELLGLLDVGEDEGDWWFEGRFWDMRNRYDSLGARRAISSPPS